MGGVVFLLLSTSDVASDLEDDVRPIMSEEEGESLEFFEEGGVRVLWRRGERRRVEGEECLVSMVVNCG